MKHLASAIWITAIWGIAMVGLALWSGPSAAQEVTQAKVTIANKRFPLDLSFLNHRPAGALGRVRAEGDGLVFGDGSPARFWGVNIQAYALFNTSRRQMIAHANRLARMGVNLVRLHHHDSNWVNPNIFGKKGEGNGDIDPDSMARLDRWISILRAEGIYVWLDLHVGRTLGDTDPDGLDFDEIIANGGDLRGYNYVNRDVKARMQDFAAQYLNHVNPHTGLAYKDDPAIMAVLVTNENDLTKHFAARMLPDKGAPNHTARYMEEAKAFAQSWGLNPDKTWRFWESGAPKLFLADLEYRFYADMVTHLRGLGYDGLIAVSNFWGRTPLSVLPALTAGDLIDVHSYGKDRDILNDPATGADMLSHIAAAHVQGLPLSVSEWNIEQFSSEDRLFAPLRLAAMAAFQGWDAMMMYGYAQSPLKGEQGAGKWHGSTDPNLIATLPAAALLFRAPQINAAQTRYVLTPSREELLQADMDANTMPALRHLMTEGAVSIALPKPQELPWLTPTGPAEGDVIVTDLGQKPKLDVQADALFQHNPQQGFLALSSPSALIAAGHLSQDQNTESKLNLSLEHDSAIVTVQSIADPDLAKAKAVLVTVALPSAPVEDRRFPFLSEPLNGVVSFEAAPGLRLRTVVPPALPAKLTHTEQGGRHVLTFRDAPSAVWLVLSSS